MEATQAKTQTHHARIRVQLIDQTKPGADFYVVSCVVESKTLVITAEKAPKSFVNRDSLQVPEWLLSVITVLTLRMSQLV